MPGIDKDHVDLLSKRAYDLAGVTNKKISVFLNGVKLPVGTFDDYVNLYLKPPKPDADQIEEDAAEQEAPPLKIEEKKHPRWEIYCSLSDGQFQQVSFVNSICTTRGGTHVDYITNQICKRLAEAIQKKVKGKKTQIKPHHIKSNLWIFINSSIENPAFDSQTKETLNTKAADFGSSVELSDKFCKQILESGVLETVMRVAEARETAKMAKDLKGGKKNKVNVPKLDDANLAGGKSSKDCTIILTEGDSAKTLAMAGIEIIGKDMYGAFPLRGKFLNVRDAAKKSIGENAEVKAICNILGLDPGKKYKNLDALRYGHVMIMTD